MQVSFARLTLEKLLNVLWLARVWQTAQLDESVLLHHVLTLQTLLKFFNLCIEN